MKVKYTLTKLLNDDELASLWQANLCLDDDEKGHKVIIKSLKSMNNLDKNAEQLFRKRAGSFLHFKNTSLVNIFDFGLFQNNFYITQEFIDGYSLQQILASLSSKQLHLPLWFTIPVLLSILQAVKTIHSNSKKLNNGYAEPIYRITPSKIFFSNKGAIKLIDTGLFRPFFNPCDNDYKSKYQQPVSIDVDRCDPCADLYSLGMILCECLTGKVPSQEYSLSEILTEYNWIPHEIASILNKSISTSPDLKFIKTEDMILALEDYLKSYSYKINNSEFMAILAILFSNDKNISSTQKQIDTWLKKVEQNEPGRISWFYEFRHAFHHNNLDAARLIDDPMMHFVTMTSGKRTNETTFISIDLQNNKVISKTSENEQSYNLPDNSDHPTTTSRTNVLNVKEQSDLTENKNNKTDKSILFVNSSEPDQSSADMWVSTRTLRLSGLRQRMAAGKSGNILSNKSEHNKTLTVKKPTGDYISTISVNKHTVNNGDIEFEMGLNALQRRDYNLALYHFEAAYQSDPDNKMYVTNLKRIKMRMNN